MLLAPAELTAGETPPSEESQPRPKPNFLVVVADDQCFRTINALNNQEVQTPTLDRCATRGTTFTHCFHQGSWTGAVCVASRAMMHTGRYVWDCGGNNCGYYPLLGEAMQMGGYDTYVVGKWHNGDQTALRSFTKGKTIGPGFLCLHAGERTGLQSSPPRRSVDAVGSEVPRTLDAEVIFGTLIIRPTTDFGFPSVDRVTLKAGPRYERRPTFLRTLRRQRR